MSTQKSEIQLVITAQNKAAAEIQKLTDELEKLKKKADTSSSSTGKMLGVLGGAAAVYGIVKKGILDSVTAWEEQEKVMAQTEAVIKSTGGAAGYTTQEIGDMASELQRTTTFADEVIQSGQNLLLTFTNIGKDVFPQATQTMLDMSIALGQDMSSSAIQLGKALQDPILGVTALRRVGVNFNETQQETIKKLVETGHGLDAQKMILKELAKEFGGSAAKQLETFGGRMTWLKNQAGELQESLGKGITKGIVFAFMQGVGGIQNFQSRMAALQVYATAFGAALVGGFTFVFRTLYNLVTASASAMALPFQVAESVVRDAVQTVKNILNGDFSVSVDNTGKVISDFGAGIKEDFGDAKSAFEDAFVGVESAISETGDTAAAAAPQMQDFGNASEDMSKKVKDAAKKISDLKKEMKDAIASAKDDIKSFKEEFKKQENEKQQDLRKSIAEIVVGKQAELLSAQQDYSKASSEEEKKTANDKIATIQQFLDSHLTDQQKYAKEIADAQRFAQMDEIQQLKFTYEEERKQRKEDYNNQLDDLKDHLKSVQKEYKNKLKDLRKDLQDELGGMSIKVDVSKSSSKKRALGGTVNSGSSYIVGENRPEVFVPSQSGNIKQLGQAGGGNIEVNFNNVTVRNDNDLDYIIRAVRETLGRDQSLASMGVKTY